MKRVIAIIIIITTIIFLFPIIFTKKFGSTPTIAKISENENLELNSSDDNINDYQYKNYGTIRLLHKSNGQVEQLNIDDYLLGVVSAEMPANFNLEALKAQAIVARTYTIFMIKNNSKHDNADICDSPTCCQAWISKEERMAKWNESDKENNWEKIEEAVYGTKGKIITYNGEPIDAFFHSNSGGKTEEVSNVWGGKDLPYLKSVETSGEDAYSQFASDVIMNKTDFENKIKSKHPEFSINYNDKDCIKVINYTEGNRVKTIKLGNINISGVEARTLLGLKSANFNVCIENDNIKFSVKGYGHGVGMSQTGADSLAKQGKNCEEIIKHFFTDVQIQNI